jgi:hypothetical protein
VGVKEVGGEEDMEKEGRKVEMRKKNWGEKRKVE